MKTAIKIAVVLGGLGPELVGNGTFNLSIDGWSSHSTGAGSISWNADLQAADLNATNGSNRGVIGRSIATEVGRTYRASVDRLLGTGTLDLRAGSSANGSQLGSVLATAVGKYIFDFVAVGTTSYITANAQAQATVDNISVRLR